MGEYEINFWEYHLIIGFFSFLFGWFFLVDSHIRENKLILSGVFSDNKREVIFQDKFIVLFHDIVKCLFAWMNIVSFIGASKPLVFGCISFFPGKGCGDNNKSSFLDNALRSLKSLKNSFRVGDSVKYIGNK